MKRLVTAAAVLSLLLTGCGGADDGASNDTPGSGAVTAEGPPTAQTVTLDSNDKLTFTPDTINAKVGTLKVTNKNVGKIPHNLVFDPESLGKSGTIDGGKSEDVTVTFDKAGTYTFVCTFHSGMDGKVVVS